MLTHTFSEDTTLVTTDITTPVVTISTEGTIPVFTETTTMPVTTTDEVTTPNPTTSVTTGLYLVITPLDYAIHNHLARNM